MAGSSLNLWRTTVSTAAKKMLNNSGDSTHPYRSPCSISNQSEQTPSSGRTQVLIPSWNYWMTAIICGGTPMRVSSCHRRVRSTVSYAFWRSMKYMKRDTPAFRPISCSLRTTNIMSAVERFGRNPHCSSGNSPFASQYVVIFRLFILLLFVFFVFVSSLPLSLRPGNLSRCSLRATFLVRFFSCFFSPSVFPVWFDLASSKL